jgi:hypothetical protein
MNQSVIDFEASGLNMVRSYPIQVAWSMPDDSIESHYIRPEPGWEYWDNQAEVEIHGIRRDLLLEQGKSARWVAERMNECLTGFEVFWDGGDWDAFWLRRLFEAAPEAPSFFAGNFDEFMPEVPPHIEAQLKSRALKVAGAAHDAANDVRFLLEYRRLAWQYHKGNGGLLPVGGPVGKEFGGPDCEYE